MKRLFSLCVCAAICVGLYSLRRDEAFNKANLADVLFSLFEKCALVEF